MFEKSRILVVDDSPMNVDLLKVILHSNGYIVATADNGTDALKILSEQKIDLVLLDVMMPGMDGFEVTRRIRGDENTKNVPIILITALHETDERIMGTEAGCDDFITTPFDKNEAMARIKTLLKLNYYRSQHDEKDKFEQVILRMHDGFLLCDSNLNIIRSNLKARDLLNLGDLSAGWQNRLFETFSSDRVGDLTADLRLRNLDFELRRINSSTGGRPAVRFSSSLIRDTDAKTVSIVIMLSEALEGAVSQPSAEGPVGDGNRQRSLENVKK